ncbi:hypothetical protein [Rhodobacter sp. SY28-1]|uniref:hypothetical protein n=1 Tax=Rhodobacter sp. SY28-1 TaxID=2562317 RepID=UPI0010C13D04|nr:hypothetical protein [Rhodobacter sp. SY28-1]
MTTERMRLGGVAFLLCGAVLVWIAVYLLTGVMGWRITPDGAGLSVLWLLVTGGVVIAMGGQMLTTGSRPRWLLRAFVVLIVVFVVTGVIVTLTSGARMPRLYL